MRAPRSFRRILRIPRPPAQQAALDIDEEFQLHLDLRTEELMAQGMSHEDARREALRAFGDRDRAREELLAPERRRLQRAGLSDRIGDLARDLRHAARGLGRSPGFAIVAILTLALGIGANTALYSVLDAVLLSPLPVRAPERLAMIWEARAEEDPDDRNSVNPANYMDWQKRSRTFEAMAGFFDSPVTVTSGDTPREVAIQLVHPRFFEILGVSPATGRTFTLEESAGPPGGASVAVISRTFWREQFGGDSSVIGRMIELGERRVEVVGVMDVDLDFISPDVAFWLPTDFAWASRQEMGRFIRVIGRLRPGATMATAEGEMEAIGADLRRELPDFNTRWYTNVVPLDDQVKGDVRPGLLVLLGAVGLLLLIACVNVANLLMVRAASRRSEIAVRAALGAGRGRIVRGLVIESLLLSAVGGVIGVTLATVTTRVLAVSVPDALRVPRLDQASVDVGVLLFALGIAVVTALLFSIAPAVEAFRTDLVGSLRDGGRGSSAGKPARRLRAAMVVGEISLSLLLLTAAGLLLRSFVELQRTDLGIRPENVVTGRVTLRGARYQTGEARTTFFQRAIESVGALPGVEAVGIVSWLPLGGSLSATGYFVPEKPRPTSGDMLVTEVQAIQGDFFPAMGIPLLQGRAFDARDVAGGTEVVIVNRAFAEQTWPGENPIGRRFIMPWDRDRTLEVVGVAGDVRQQGVETAAGPGLFLPHPQFAQFASASILVKTSTAAPTIQRQVVDRIHEIDPRLAVADLRTMRQVVADAIARPRLTSLLISCFAGLALLLAAVGIYGVVSYTVSLRAKEMGVRRALGAQASHVARLILGDALRLGAVGVGIGLVVAFFATRVMAKLLYDVSATDPLTFAATAMILLAVSVLAALAPALRAARVNPTDAIRAE
jgi:putative ABC transport system permease protein